MKKILTILSIMALVIVARISIAVPASALVPSPGVVGWWHFDEGTGDWAYDSSIYNNHASLRCGAGFGPGVSGTALTLNLEVDVPEFKGSYAYIPYSDSLNIAGPYTFEAYLQIKNLTDHSNAYRPIFLNGPNSTGAQNQEHSIEIYVKGSESLIVGHNRRTGGIFGEVRFPCPPIATGEFFHLVITFDGTKVKAYYDGVEQGAIGGNNTIPVPSGSLLGWWIGRLLDDEFPTGSPSNQSGFCGLIDELRIWNSSGPVVNITSPANAVYLAGTVPALAYTVDDPDATVSADAIDQTAGVHTLTVTATNAAGLVGSDSVTYVVYDPTGGFVTGGGFIMSPPGAYTPPGNPEYVDNGGKAAFGFVSKYLKGGTVPAGNTEFQFHAGNLNFKTETYEWLVVDPNGASAQFKGTGTINGAGSFTFMVWAVDNSGTGNPDTFRIKIWQGDDTETVVYDNGSNQPIDGGSIVVHTKK